MTKTSGADFSAEFSVFATLKMYTDPYLVFVPQLRDVLWLKSSKFHAD